MNAFGLIFLIVNAIALMALPHRWAPLPLLMGACYITAAQSIDVGPFHFTVLRILLLLGAIRAVTRGERLVGGLNAMDGLLLAWGAWLLFSSFFHKPFAEALVFRLGASYNILGIYFLIRIFCRNKEDLTQLIKITAILLVPVALEMINEKLTAQNLFGFLDGTSLDVIVRDGKLRANGPFGHPILAGTVGAVCIPLMVGIWRQHTRIAKIGLAACLGMVVASTSSGPLMSAVFGVFALGLWRWRHFTRQMRVAAVLIYIALEIVMKDPAYFIIDRIDLTGSSTGWFRCELIRSSFEHLNEWWFAGTDYTRHWMPTGVTWSLDHTDITNQYLLYAVWGGLPLMLLFICVIIVAFRYVGQSLRLQTNTPFHEQFLIWSLGAGLFAHVATCISVAYFEQSAMFLYLNLAAIGSLRTTALAAAREESSFVSDSMNYVDEVAPPAGTGARSPRS